MCIPKLTQCYFSCLNKAGKNKVIIFTRRKKID